MYMHWITKKQLAFFNSKGQSRPTMWDDESPHCLHEDMWLVISSSWDISCTNPAWLHFCMVNHKEVDDCFWMFLDHSGVYDCDDCWFEEFANPYLSIFGKDLQYVEINSRTTSRLVWPNGDRELPTSFCFVLTTSHDIPTMCQRYKRYVWSFRCPSYPFLFFGDSRNLHFKSHNFRINFDGDMAQFTLVSWIYIKGGTTACKRCHTDVNIWCICWLNNWLVVVLGRCS